MRFRNSLLLNRSNQLANMSSGGSDLKYGDTTIRSSWTLEKSTKFDKIRQGVTTSYRTISSITRWTRHSLSPRSCCSICKGHHWHPRAREAINNFVVHLRQNTRQQRPENQKLQLANRKVLTSSQISTEIPKEGLSETVHSRMKLITKHRHTI